MRKEWGDGLWTVVLTNFSALSAACALRAAIAASASGRSSDCFVAVLGAVVASICVGSNFEGFDLFLADLVFCVAFSSIAEARGFAYTVARDRGVLLVVERVVTGMSR